jgi:DNA-directed RNA polymerase specialized sigma24 family protein
MIAQLPDTHQEVVELYVLNGVPQQEIAEQLGVSLCRGQNREFSGDVRS